VRSHGSPPLVAIRTTDARNHIRRLRQRTCSPGASSLTLPAGPVCNCAQRQHLSEIDVLLLTLMGLQT